MNEPEQWAVKQHIEKNPKCEWLCNHTHLENLGERQGEGVKYFMDGDKWCATLEDFIDLMKSPAGFGDTKQEALESLRPQL